VRQGAETLASNHGLSKATHLKRFRQSTHKLSASQAVQCDPGLRLGGQQFRSRSYKLFHASSMSNVWELGSLQFVVYSRSRVLPPRRMLTQRPQGQALLRDPQQCSHDEWSWTNSGSAPSPLLLRSSDTWDLSSKPQNQDIMRSHQTSPIDS
jgi:hypothetical protein